MGECLWQAQVAGSFFIILIKPLLTLQYYYGKQPNFFHMKTHIPQLFTILLFISSGISRSYANPQENELFLVQNGKTDYRIVISRNAGETEKKAATEFQRYIREISGAKLRIITDKRKIREYEIILGRNRHLEEIYPSMKYDNLEEDGFTILTHDKKLIIAGGTQKGLIYGVYTFLEKYLGCRIYSSKVKIIPRYGNITFDQINDTQVPVIKFREDYYRDVYDPLFMDWHKLDSHRDEWGYWVHTFHRFVPPEEYFGEHPEYYAMLNGQRVPHTQLCLSDTNVFNLLVSNLQKRIEENPKAHYWSVSQNDTYGYCQCTECQAIDNKEDSHSGSVIHFVNKVAAKFPDKTISTLAYQYSRSAPKHIVPADNVNIMFCSIECNRSRPIITDPSSESFREDMGDWSAITDNIVVWDYVIQFQNLVSPFPNLRVLQPNIQFFVENNAKAMFQQGNREAGGEFAELRAYLIAKLLWDPYIDIDSVMNDFLFVYYEDAGPYIREYIDIMHDALELSEKDLAIFGSPIDHMDGYLVPDLVEKYNALFDKAEGAVAGQPDVLERVKIARLPLDYAMLEIARATGTGPEGIFMKENNIWTVKPEVKKRLEEFVNLCNKAGVTRLKEWHTTPNDYREIMKRVFEISMVPHKALKKKVTMIIPASKKYSGGNAGILTDGLMGTSDWYYMWLGWEEDDMEVVIDLEEVKKISKISAEFLQDIRSWIFMPEFVKYSGSVDGKNFKEIGRIDNDTPVKEEGVIIKGFKTEVEDVEARYIKIYAKNMGLCPDWHIGGEGKAWIFLDEIVIR